MALLQKSYLGATPLFRNEDWYEQFAPVLKDNVSATVTADATAHVKGAWTQIIGSTSADTSYLLIQVSSVSTSATDTSTLLDLGTGASGSETAFASNICIGGAQSLLVAFPIKIPSGTRVAARIQSVIGSKTAFVTIWTIDDGHYDTAPTSVDVIGADAATSTGTAFSGASGTWVEGIASTSQAYRAVALAVAIQSDNAPSGIRNYGVGVGASGSEIQFGAYRANAGTAENFVTERPYALHFGRRIPAGTRLAVRHAFTADPQTYGFTLIGIP
jgi:hypothetical protein